jgi:hypothetical protein
MTVTEIFLASDNFTTDYIGNYTGNETFFYPPESDEIPWAEPDESSAAVLFNAVRPFIFAAFLFFMQ